MLTNLVHLLDLSVIRNKETASRFEKAQSAAWPHSARERGNIRTICEELVKVNRDRLNECIADQCGPDPLESSYERSTTELYTK